MSQFQLRSDARGFARGEGGGGGGGGGGMIAVGIDSYIMKGFTMVNCPG